MRNGLLVCAWLAGCGSPASSPAGEVDEPGLVLVREDPSDAPLAGLSDEELARFAAGDARFELPFRASQGLGPLYIHRSCTSCHEDDGRGPGTVRRLAYLGDGDARAALPHGDVVRPRLAGGAQVPLLTPDRPDVRATLRLGPAVFARGYLEAVSDETILAYEEAQRARDDGISGRAHRVPRASAIPLSEGAGTLGRFGLKARIANLEEFVADALLGDMGLTSPLRPEELVGPEGLTDDLRPGVDVGREEVSLLTDYVRLLALPPRAEPDASGRALFDEVRCAVCHVPAVRTRADYPVDALRDVEVALYTDLLLHDMGEALADGITEHDATGREWKTPPLVGLRHLRGLLHDGRAADAREAIEAHGAEGSEAVDSHARFRALSVEQQATLLMFVEGL